MGGAAWAHSPHAHLAEELVDRREYVLKRVAYGLIALFAVAVFNFFLFRILPGDPARLLIPRQAYGLQAAESFRQTFHLDGPLYSQFLHYLVDTPRLKLGLSFSEKRLVIDVVAERVVPTLLLVGVGEVLAILVGFIFGVLSGWRRGSRGDLLATGIGMLFYAMPSFWLGLNLIIIFAVELRWFPTGGMQQQAAIYANWLAHAADVLRHIVLPATTWALVYMGYYFLIVRTSVASVSREDFVLTARAKGLSDGGVLWKHVVRNALLPTVTVVMLNLGFVIAGSILVETVFNWPGMGLLTYEAILSRDYPVMQAIFLLSAVLVIVANIVADILYCFIDPRVKP